MTAVNFSGPVVSGNGFTGDVTGNVTADSVAMSATELTASGAVTAGIQSIELNHTTVAIAATIATSVAHPGFFIAKATSEPGAGQDHTLTLTAGTFDGTNSVATFADVNDAILVYFDSAGDGTIIENVGAVALS